MTIERPTCSYRADDPGIAGAYGGRLSSATCGSAAVASCAKLPVEPTGNWVNVGVGKVRAAAAANGWVIVELPVESSTTQTGLLLRQQPSPSATMVTGSVLYASGLLVRPTHGWYEPAPH